MLVQLNGVVPSTGTIAPGTMGTVGAWVCCVVGAKVSPGLVGRTVGACPERKKSLMRAMMKLSKKAHSFFAPEVSNRSYTLTHLRGGHRRDVGLSRVLVWLLKDQRR